MDLEREVMRIISLQEMASNAEEERRKKLQEVREKILAGETTGDKIRDFSIAVHGNFDEETEEPYRQLEGILKGNEGEQIFVARINETENTYETLMYIGELNSSELDFSFGNLAEEQTSTFSSYLRFSMNNPYQELLDADGIIPSIIVPSSPFVMKKTHLISTMNHTKKDNWELCDESCMKVNYLEIQNKGIGKDYKFLEFSSKFDLAPRDSRYSLKGIDGGFRAAVVKIGEDNIRGFFKEQRVHDISEYEKAVEMLKEKMYEHSAEV